MTEKPKCPYSESGICYHKTCIYRPHLDCLKINEYRDRLKYAKKGKKKHERKGIKNI